MPNAAAVGLEAVILSSDPQLIETLTTSLQRFEIDVATFSESEAASSYISTRKVDTIIVDSEVEGGVLLLNKVRHMPSNSRTPTFAAVHTRDLYSDVAAGAHFVIEKPVSSMEFERALHAARGMMLGERRRYHRQPVQVPITVARAGGQMLCNGTTVNISENGLALRCEPAVRKEEILNLQFTLPNAPVGLRCSGEVVWADSKGLGGIRFLPLRKDDQRLLATWIESEFERWRGIPHGSPQ